MEILKSNSKHWDTIFLTKEDTKLGWYEKSSIHTFELLNQIPELENSTVFVSGIGTSNIAEELLNKKVKLIVNDISFEALNKVKKRLKEKSSKVIWLCQDISKPIPNEVPKVDIWIDRAVLHFLTDNNDIIGYFSNLKTLLKTKGYAVFAEFSKEGAEKCAGLVLHRYSVEEILDYLGKSFSLIAHFNYTYINPNGEPRPYIYALYKRES
jgi:SAM-dependent methyltransferase